MLKKGYALPSAFPIENDYELKLYSSFKIGETKEAIYQFYHKNMPLEIWLDQIIVIQTNYLRKDIVAPNDLAFEYKKQITGDEFEEWQEAIEHLKEWRDEVFKKPISLTHKENNKKITETYCTELIDNKEIFVDLAKQTKETTCSN